MTILSGQSVNSRVYTSRFGNGNGTSAEVVLKKYQVPGTVPSGKSPKSEPYRAVPCSGKAPLVHPWLYSLWCVQAQFFGSDTVGFCRHLFSDVVLCVWPITIFFLNLEKYDHYDKGKLDNALRLYAIERDNSMTSKQELKSYL